jgi:cytochrome o ubiquinol oxidase operon protein cyoD
MSLDSHAGHEAAHGHDAGHHDAGDAHGTLKGYLTGFGLSVILTAIPFWMVMTGAMESKYALALSVLALAVVQVVVHMIYFLHMNFRSQGGWSMMALIFTIVFVAIGLSGSVWVMYHLNANMGPGADTSQMP